MCQFVSTKRPPASSTGRTIDMIDNKPTRRGGAGRCQGRKPGKTPPLIPIAIRIRPDQAEWLNGQTDKQAAIRAAIDAAISSDPESNL